MDNRIIYNEHSIVLYKGDCRDILPAFSSNRFEAVITDPIWPNAPAGMFDITDTPYEILEVASKNFARVAKRSVIHLGSNSDPRFHNCLPNDLPFFRQVFLEYLIPNKLGRILYTHDVAYIFGNPPTWKKGQKVIPGRCVERSNIPRTKENHPCPRRLFHVQWLVRWFSDNGLVLDPFCGSGTTLVAARIMGVPAVGIEVDPKHCDSIVKRLEKFERQQQLVFA